MHTYRLTLVHWNACNWFALDGPALELIHVWPHTSILHLPHEAHLLYLCQSFHVNVVHRSAIIILRLLSYYNSGLTIWSSAFLNQNHLRLRLSRTSTYHLSLSLERASCDNDLRLGPIISLLASTSSKEAISLD